MQQQRLWKFGAITIFSAERFGEPQQFTTTTTRTINPFTVMPTDRISGKCAVMLTRATRSTSSVECHMYFVDGVNPRCQLGNKKSA
jgi:hypothetical protein